jgi:hypothetical protein
MVVVRPVHVRRVAAIREVLRHVDG